MTKKESNEIAIIEKKEVTPVEAKIAKLTIESPKDMQVAAEYLSQLNIALDKIVAYREAKTKPLNATLKLIRAETKGIETRLETHIESLRSKIGAYQTEATRIAAKKAEDIAGRVGDGKGYLKPTTAMAKIDEIDTPATEVVADSGSLKFRTVKKYRVTNIKAVPSIFLTVDDANVKAAMNRGEAIEGIEYYTEQIPVNSR